MKIEDFKKVIALVFKKGKEDFPFASNKTQLAKKIVKTSEINNVLSFKSLVNYFNYFFDNGKDVPNPNEYTISLLLKYINFQTQKQFINNSTAINYLKDVPFLSPREDAKPEDKIQEKTPQNKPIKPIHITVKNEQKNIQTTPIHLTVNNENLISTPKQNWYIGIIVIVAIVISGFFFSMYWQNQKNTICGYWELNKYVQIPCDSNKQGIQIQSLNINEVNINTFRKIEPTNESQFFSKKNGKPQVWYTSYNNEIDFFNENGLHPITKEQLRPVTKEIVKEYVIEQKNVTATDKIIEKPSIINTAIINTKNNNEVSIFIFDSVNQIDKAFSNRLKQELVLKNYKVTSMLIFPSQLTSEVIERLQVGDLNYFNNDLQKYTDFICVGSVYYEYSQSTVQADLAVCKMQVDYSIISTKTGGTIDMYSNSITGSHFSKTTAKNNAIKKFTL